VNRSEEKSRKTFDPPTSHSVANVRDDFEAEWVAGGHPLIEEFLGHTEETERSALLCELLKLEIDYRRRANQRPTAPEYQRRFPEFESVVSDLFERIAAEAGADSVDVAQASTVAYRRDDGDTSLYEQVTGNYDPLGTLPPSSAGRVDAAEAKGSGDQPRPQHRFGNYVLIEEIARGGMGVVYKAEQIKPKRVVALKVIQSGQLAGAEEIRRFETEAEAAGNLDHPNIVPIFDVGESGGRHYFSMAYVEGEDLKRRLVDGPLPNREAARIVKIVSEAMAHAHASGIIHRDLKPENVLVDSSGQPRITDFGLAKRIGGDSSLTATGQVLGTPSYMSPEQAGGEAEKIGPASDVYAMGAILYCVLTGRPPFQAANVMDTLLQVMQSEPVPPRDLNTAIDQDLETLCLKCLQKETTRRLASAQELADELARFLRGEPIRARPIGRIGRAWRWCRRNRVVAGLLATVMMTLIVGASISTYFAMLARERARHAEEGTRVAVKSLQSIIYNVQEKLKPINEARDIRRDLLKSSLKDLQELSADFASRTSVDHSTAVALVDLGHLFEELGEDENNDSVAAAEGNYRRAAEIYRQLADQEPDNLSLQRDLTIALEHLGNLLLFSGRFSEAHVPLQETLKIRRRIIAEEPTNSKYQREICWALINCGDAFIETNRLFEAQKYFEEALGVARAMVADDPTGKTRRDALLIALEKVGDVNFDAGKIAEARAAYEESYEINRGLYEAGPETANLLISYSTSCERMGDIHAKTGEMEVAREKYEQMVGLSEKAATLDKNNNHLLTEVAVAYDRVGEITIRLKDWPAAKKAYRKAIEVRTSLVESGAANRRVKMLLSENKQKLMVVIGRQKKNEPIK